MEFAWSETQRDLRETTKALMQRHADEAYLRELDETASFPDALYRVWGEAGLLALPFAEDLGGIGASLSDLAVVAEQIAWYGTDIGSAFTVPLLVGMTIARHGSEAQRRDYLPRLAAGQVRFCISIAEPEAGSDVMAMRTQAVPHGDGYRINGEKVFASGAAARDMVIMLLCRSRPDGKPREGITCFLVPNDQPGVVVHPIDTLGRRAFAAARIFLEDVAVSDTQRLGPLHQGWNVFLWTVERERVLNAALYVGNAQGVFDRALEHAKQRQQFGQPIGHFQAIAHLFADMHASIEAARLLTYRAAWLIDQGEPAGQASSMAKLVSSETLVKVTEQAMQIMGGHAYVRESPIQRFFRDARITTITNGTSQIHRNILAGYLGLKVR